MSESIGRFDVVERLAWDHPVAACVARDPTLGRLVTLRYVSQATSGLRREAMAPAHVDHVGIATLHEVLRQEDRLVVVFEHVGGVPLVKWLATRRRSAELRALVAASARIVEAIHAAGVVHGDLCAASFVVDPHRRPWIVDLGLAGVVAERIEVRTPAFDQRAFARIWLEQRGLPASVRAALSRTWPSMTALAEALERRARSRMWIAPVAVVAAAAAAGGAFVAMRHSGDRATPATPPAAPTKPIVARAIGPADGCSDWPMFSDAHTLVFAHRGAKDGVYAMDVRTDETRWVVDEPGVEMALQRDGRDGQILLMRGDDVVALDVAAGKEVKLPRRFDWFLNPFVAGDGKGGLYHVGMGSRGLYVYAEGRVRALATVPAGESIMHMAISADGKLAVLTGGRGLYVVDLVAAAAANAPFELEPLKAGIAYQRAAVTPERIVYYPRRDGIARLDVASGKDELILPGAVAPGGIALSPDGTTIVWSECRMRASITEAGNQLFAESLSWPGVGPDGSLVFTLDLPSGAVAVRRTPDGTLIRLSSQELGVALTPAMSPDGKDVAFTIDGAAAGVYVAPADGSAPPRLVAPGGVHSPMWLPDGRLAFARPDDAGATRLFAIPKEGGEPVSIHPRSRRLADVIPATGEVLLVDGGFQNLWRWNPTTGAETSVKLPRELELTALAVVRASPDGATALVTPGMFDAIWRLDLRGKNPAEKLHQGDVASVAGAVYTRDGKALFAINTAAGGLRAATVR